jgi:hypothetical protein
LDFEGVIPKVGGENIKMSSLTSDPHREARKTSALSALLKDKLEAQKTLKSLEGEPNRKRRELFDAQDAIDGQRDELIKRIEGQLHQTHAVKTIFLFRWRLA